jgi:hypothetical protein
MTLSFNAFFKRTAIALGRRTYLAFSIRIGYAQYTIAGAVKAFMEI